jgi:hypothetical protein
VTLQQSFTHALFHLASRPEYIDPIRKEVETIVAEDGWTKVAMTRMRKLDSFLKESQRLNGLGACESRMPRFGAASLKANANAYPSAQW